MVYLCGFYQEIEGGVPSKMSVNETFSEMAESIFHGDGW